MKFHTSYKEWKRTKTFQAGLIRLIKAHLIQLNELLHVERLQPLFTVHSRTVRDKRCLKLLNHLKNKGGNVYVFVNIKKLLVDEVVNELLS